MSRNYVKKRYTALNDGRLLPNADGSIVLYADRLARIAALKQENAKLQAAAWREIYRELHRDTSGRVLTQQQRKEAVC